MTLKEQLLQIVHDETSHGYADLKDVLLRVLSRVGELLDDQNTPIGDTAEPVDESEGE